MFLDKQPSIATKNPWLSRFQETHEKIDLIPMFLEEIEKRFKLTTEEHKLQERRVEISSLHIIEPHVSKLNTPTDERTDKRISVSVIFNGEKYDALVDTGATDSCIRHDIATEHGIEVHSVPGIITLADENQTIPRIGRTENIEVQYNNQVAYAPFEIIEKCYPFIIGMDYFH